MSKFMKFIRVIWSLIVIVTVGLMFTAFYYFDVNVYGDLHNTLADFVGTLNGFYTFSILAGLTALGGLILLIATLVRPTHIPSLTLVDSHGKVELNEDVIEAYAKRSLYNFYQIGSSKINCKIHDGKDKKVVLKIDSELENTVNATDLAQRVQDRVRDDINLFIGQDITDVKINFVENKEKKTNKISQVDTKGA